VNKLKTITMKKFILFLILGFCFSAINAQKVIDRKKNVQDLKESMEMYAVVVLTPQGAVVGTMEMGASHFIDEKNNHIELKTTAQILNFMHRHGWDYINTLGGTDGATPQYIFRKRE
jgi:hypothetical protein